MIRKCFIAGFIVAIIGFASLVLLVRREIFLTPRTVSFSTQQLNEAMREAGGEELLGKEAAAIILRFGSKSASNRQMTNYPAVTKMASLVGGEIPWLEESQPGVPTHIKIRRGGHFDYQFIYIFGTGSVPTLNSGLIPVGGPVYLRNTSPDSNSNRPP